MLRSAVMALIACMLTCTAVKSYGQTEKPVLITQAMDEEARFTLRGNLRPEANQRNDRGLLPDDFPLEHMLLQLQRSPEQQKSLESFLQELSTPGSRNFHRWLTADQFGSNFGLSTNDVEQITDWLQIHGFKVNAVYANATLIDFSGTAGQVREAFQTEIHSLEVNGRQHYANMSDPQVPIALAPAIAGIVSLHDFTPAPMYKNVHKGHINPSTGSLVSTAEAEYTLGGTYQPVVPADLATIYNLVPLFNAGYTGTGQKIVVIEDTNVYSSADWQNFRSEFGLSRYTSGAFTTVHPATRAGSNCANPGITEDELEAILDAEWASAAAPGAVIELASCADSATFGGLIALQNIINGTSATNGSSLPPALVSVSYGECEAVNGAAANAAYNAAYEQAAAEGISVFVSAGDEGAAGCDANSSKAVHGIAVSGLASTPYNVAVGGTDFGDTYAGTNSSYWSASNASSYGSAKSYVPEIPWNDSCGSVLLATYATHSGTTYGASGFCNSSFGAGYLTTSSGSGGPSGCAVGRSSVAGVMSGTCQGYGKPAWQSGVVGNPKDGVRDIPDISLFSANGVWGHYYVFCWSDTSHGGRPCAGAPSGWSGAGGTSFASPIMAGIQALVNQKNGRQGNPNPAYYALAAQQYGSSGSPSCNSTSGNAASSSCTFYDVTRGDMDVNCTGSHNCYNPSGANGVLSTSGIAYSKAYGAATGWDFATGIGSVNATNLLNNWTSAQVKAK